LRHTLDDGSEFGVDPEDIRYYESIDLIDAAHPQTILAYDMNARPLIVPPGAPLRLRPELRSAAGRQSSLRLAEELRRSRKGKIGPAGTLMRRMFGCTVTGTISTARSIVMAPWST